MSDHDPNGDDDFLTNLRLNARDDFPFKSFAEGYALGKRESKTKIESLKEEVRQLKETVKALKKALT